MTRIDMDGSEAEFIEFEFPDEASAEAADKLYPFAAHTGGTTRIVRSERVGEARAAMEAGGARWEESESSVDEDEMWPEWPGDGDESDGPDGDDDDDVPEEDTSPPGP